MHLTTYGLVLREVTYKESDKILTIFTQDYGKVTATARGCRKKASALAAGCQLLVWAQFVLYQYKDRWAVKEASTETEFKGLSLDLPRFSLGCYFAELGEVLSIEDLPQPELLSLLLNCLHVLEKKPEIPAILVKAVFEFRAICQSGYEPMLEGCSVCLAEHPVNPKLSLKGGTTHCASCNRDGILLSDATLSTLNFLISAPSKQIFSFSLSNPNAFATLCEAYLLTQLDRNFKTLDFYKKIAPP